MSPEDRVVHAPGSIDGWCGESGPEMGVERVRLCHRRMVCLWAPVAMRMDVGAGAGKHRGVERVRWHCEVDAPER